MPDFARFDSRGYRTVDARTGYGEWVASYERTVEDAMDLELLDRLTTVDWASATRAADLGCGTGRTGAWLHARGADAIDGADLTPEMLERAAARGIYDRLVEADVGDTGLPSGTYDLAVCCLVDEHLADLRPLYAEAARVCAPGAAFVLLGLHPHMFMVAGMPTHYDSASGEPIAIETHVHLAGEHVDAAHAAGWTLLELRERLIDDDLIACKPRWERLREHPVTVAYAWRAPAAGEHAVVH